MTNPIVTLFAEYSVGERCTRHNRYQQRKDPFPPPFLRAWLFFFNAAAFCEGWKLYRCPASFGRGSTSSAYCNLNYCCVSFLCIFPSRAQDGTNALMAAASNGHLEAATSLVKAGAALDKQNSDGHSALMFAYNGRAQVRCAVPYSTVRTSPCHGKQLLTMYLDTRGCFRNPHVLTDSLLVAEAC